MFIHSLKIHNFRNIKYREFSFSKKINIFYGDNGVGKTSILESIYFLSTSKSFRKSTSKSIINFDSDSVTVFSESDLFNSLAISKFTNGKWLGKLNSKSINKQSQLSGLIKVIAIDPEVYRLVDFGPQYRRSFIDWFVFHVEHDYLELWKKVNKCIKQLNLLYKHKASNSQISVWELSLIQFSDELNNKRSSYFKVLVPQIRALISLILPELSNIKIEFYKGWQNTFSLKEQLKIDRDKNLKYGQLQNGPHKMDIKITTGKTSASQSLSRGQKKSLSIIFYLAYLKFLVNNQNHKPIVCLDDLDAEIDLVKLEKITELFNELNVQLFITTLEVDKLKNLFSDKDLFHVKHEN